MATTKNLCAQIPIDLHERVSEERERLGQTTSEYIANLIQDYYNMMENQKGGIQMTEKGRTMAFQIPEELFQRIKRHLERETLRSGKKLTQRDFVLNLITQALDEADAENTAEQNTPTETPVAPRVADVTTPADTDTPNEDKDRLNTCYMVMQEVNHQLFTETVLDEVLISMEEENQEWAEEILSELDLIGFKDRPPMSLSGGQKQRVAIASAIASKRSILFFDEPTSGLDYKHMKEVANVLKQVRDAGITLYGITHDLELLLDCCTDIVHFEDGSIIDKFQMDEAGLEKIRNYFIKGVPTK